MRIKKLFIRNGLKIDFYLRSFCLIQNLMVGSPVCNVVIRLNTSIIKADFSLLRTSRKCKKIADV